MRSAADELKSQIDGVDPDAFCQALAAEGRRRVDTFLRGIEVYRDHPYRRKLPPVPVVWQEGTTRILDYSQADYSQAGAGGLPVLVIPSLINRAYILDLTARRSFMRYLGEKGFRPFLVDWDAPGAEEQSFGLDDYVAGRLGRVLDAVTAMAGPPVLVGYCMGGLLALAIGAIRPADVRGLALLATPWDFHAAGQPQGRMVESLRQPFEHAIAMFGGLPVDVLQGLFTALDPASIERKFCAFSRLKANSAKARNFVALEDWLNDGVPLAAKVARECLFGWYIDNRPARGQWMIGGTAVLPQHFHRPTLAVIPAHDRIVPPASAMALAEALPQVSRKILSTGHIGMIAGTSAKTNVYRYIAEWLNHLGDP